MNLTEIWTKEAVAPLLANPDDLADDPNMTADQLLTLNPAAYAILQEKKQLKQREDAVTANDDWQEVKQRNAQQEKEDIERISETIKTPEQWDNRITQFAGFTGKQAQISGAIKFMLEHSNETIQFGIQKGYFKDKHEGEVFMSDARRYKEITEKARSNNGKMSPEDENEIKNITERNQKNIGLFKKVLEAVDEQGHIKAEHGYVDFLDGCYATGDFAKSSTSLIEQLEKLDKTKQEPKAYVAQSLVTDFSNASSPVSPQKDLATPMQKSPAVQIAFTKPVEFSNEL